MTKFYEVRPTASAAKKATFTQVPWSNPGVKGSAVRSSVDPWFSQLGPVGTVAIDFGRIAAAAYVADRLTRRGLSFSRTLAIHVHLIDSAPWKPVLKDLQVLLSWLSGDDWTVTVCKATGGATGPTPLDLVDDTPPAAVALFSGGLDSFAGAVLPTGPTLYLAHSDNPTVKAAQTTAWGWLDEQGLASQLVSIRLSEASKKKENTTRTRALLFYALAAAVADARGIGSIEVPENGFTGLNLALGGDRGGVLSTRSTHPRTIALVGQLMEAVGLPVTLANTHAHSTKGELVEEAATQHPEVATGLATTLSCAKLDGRVYPGGDPNLGCGLCVACLTRRSSILAAGIDDPTPYLATTLTGQSLDMLWQRRAVDVEAVRRRAEIEVDEFVLLETGGYPDDYDLTAATELCRRGFDELRAMVATL